MKSNRPLWLATLLFVVLATVSPVFAQDQSPVDAQSDPAALAIYADAANFQTNGAIDLAIDNWKEFLKKFPKDKLAPQAAHYLGVCYMTANPPKLAQAAAAFNTALKSKDYDLRQESLSNRGWCLYAAGTHGDQPDKSVLRESLKTYEQLLKEFPDSVYRDRAYFYIGESSYALGELKSAIESYSQLLQMDGAAESPLRCDALYARAIAQEEDNDSSAAAKSFEQLLQSCGDSDFVVDVQLRLADLWMLSNRYQDAMSLFQKVLDDSTGLATDDDRAVAMFRQAFCYAKLNRPTDAANQYQRLLEKYPHSRFAAASKLAAAQSFYQAGNTEKAAAAFQFVLAGENPVASTEAAHWLARIYLAKANASPSDSPEMIAAAKAAYRVAAQQLKTGAEGEYAIALQLDAAEALSFQKERLAEALSAFEAIAREQPDSSLAPRATYNAAYLALQLERYEQAAKFSSDFANNYADDPLLADAIFIGAEAKLLSGKSADAAQQYSKLISNPAYHDNSQRAQWILRGATALQAAGQPAEAAKLIEKELDTIQKPSDRAQAWMIAGQAQLKNGDAAAAAQSFQASRAADPHQVGRDEALLLIGQAKMEAGDRDGAVASWQELVRTAPDSRAADRARFKLGQLASDDGDYASAIKQFDPVIDSRRDPALRPFALYGKGWAQMSSQDYASAAETLSLVITEFPEHPLFDDALLARGITFRNLKRFDESANDLTRFLDTHPSGIRLGHALYELALVKQKLNQSVEAAMRLKELVNQVPDYPDMDKVLYELGWSLTEAGDTDAALDQFQRLITNYPDNPMIREAAYFVGQSQYKNEQWAAAARSFQTAADSEVEGENAEDDLLEKSLYRLGWSLFKDGRYPEAEAAFMRQYREAESGPLSLDAIMMVGESRFKQNNFEAALQAYETARKRIVAANDSAKTVRDESERQVRELTLLHGGQSAAQLKDWDSAINWYDELRKRFPATTYLAQVFYETGFAYQQAGNEMRALELFGQVADNYRNELAARARFMMGEIYFAQKEYSKAIPEFQRVMYGFGAANASDDIKNWQAKSGFEAGRCAESLADVAQTESAQEKARGFAERFYQYVVDEHGGHELSGKSRVRLKEMAK